MAAWKRWKALANWTPAYARQANLVADVAAFLEPLLDYHEEIRFVFVAEADLDLGTFFARAALHGPIDPGNMYVVVTDRSVLLVEKRLPFSRDRQILARIPRPATFGPVTGRGWILLDGQPLMVIGGRKTIAAADAALAASP